MYCPIIKKAGLLSGFLLFCNLAIAQDLNFFGLFPVFNQTGRIGKKADYNLIVSSVVDAFNEKIGGVEYPASDLLLYIQPSIIYTYSPNVNFAGGYIYQRNNPFNGNYVNDHRIWQQIIFLWPPADRGKITNRVRFEERFVEDRTTGRYPFSTRLRYQIGYSVPFRTTRLDKNKFYFNSSNEFYFSLTGNKNATYSENISYAGIGYNTGKVGKVEAGYYLDTSVRNKQKDLRFLHLIQITWATKFDFLGKKSTENAPQ